MRYHLSTLVVMTLVAGVLLGLNMHPWPYGSWPTAVMTRLSDWDLWCFGWPASFCKQAQPNMIAAFTRDLHLFPFMVDVGFAVFLTLGFGWVNERWLNFKDVLAQVRAGSRATPHR
jgi:hypothetical protein